MAQQIFRKIWGRRQARPLKARQKHLLENILPTVAIALDKDINIQTIPYSRLWLEIGFGGGEHLSHQAQLHRDIGILGCEPFVNGVASLLGYIDDHQLGNVRIIQDDARLLLSALPDQSLEKIFVLFPDPWPKQRHHKRRIINQETVQQFLRLLKPQGWLILATDIADYALWMQQAIEQVPQFVLELGERSSLHERPEGWLITRYEQKGCDQGRVCTYLTYQKREI